MKKIHLLFIFVLAFSQTVNAQPRLGGEITWEQNLAGDFIFSFKYYHNCRAGCCSGLDSVQMNSDSPLGSFMLYMQSGYPIEVSPQCSPATNLPHINCATSTGNNPGAVKEILLKSAPLSLLDTIPLSGWTFYIDLSAFRPWSKNLGSVSLRVRSKMFPFLQGYPAAGNSPVFHTSPFSIYHGGDTIKYRPWAVDSELDSLTFEFAPILSSGGLTPSFNAGYSYLSPLPGTYHNSNNMPASHHPVTGEIISKTVAPIGNEYVYYVNQKVTEHRCGIKIAEIYRDLCFFILPSDTNNQPQILLSTNLQKDTVYYGQHVHYDIGIYDYDLQINGDSQSYYYEYFGDEFGSYVPASGSNPPTLSINQGCNKPPCATLTPASNRSNPIHITGNQTLSFDWDVPCSPISDGCGTYKDRVNFTIKATDDHCPVPAFSYADILLYLDYMPTIKKPEILALTTLNDTTISITWDSIHDPNLTHLAIMRSDSMHGGYSDIAHSTGTSFEDIIYTTSSSNKYYYIIPYGIACPDVDLLKHYKDSVSNMVLNTSVDADYNCHLQWNPIRDNNSQQQTYRIYKNVSKQGWQMIATTKNNLYVDSVTACDDTVQYKIGSFLSYSLGYSSMESYSNITENYILDLKAPDMPIIDSLVIDPITADAHLYWRKQSYPNDTVFVVFKKNYIGLYDALDTLFGLYSFTDTTNNPQVPLDVHYAIACLDNCFNASWLSRISDIKSSSEDHLSIFPNPVENRLTIKSANDLNFQGEFVLFDMLSKQIHFEKIHGKQVSINLSHLPAGFYHYSITIKGFSKPSYGILVKQ
jgi:hypothetical protein